MQKSQEDQLTAFYQEFHNHLKREDEQMKRLIECQQQNAAAIEKLAVLCADMQSIVDIYQSVLGTLKVGSAAQAFGLWLIKWPLIGAGLYAAYSWLLDHFSQR